MHAKPAEQCTQHVLLPWGMGAEGLQAALELINMPSTMTLITTCCCLQLCLLYCHLSLLWHYQCALGLTSPHARSQLKITNSKLSSEAPAGTQAPPV